MALFDWNGNGNKNDMVDNYIEYQVFTNLASENNTPRTSNNTSGTSYWIVFIIACVVSAFSEGLGALIFVGYLVLKWLGM